MTGLQVNEVFETIQGEGFWTGTPSIFVRLQGCPVGCPWCDTKHTWDLLPNNLRSVDVIMQENEESAFYFSASPESLFALFKDKSYTAKHIVITGGEPCMFDLVPFTELAHKKGYSTQIETSGTFSISCSEETWVTVSPKINMKAGMPVLVSAMQRANEIKHPVAMQKHIDELNVLLQESDLTQGNNKQNEQSALIYLQPISQQERATQLAVDTCIKNNWRLSVQLHKYIGVE
ncbi:7-carboxy-7-deazaguanine synthase QueE [Glaciecola petra]|uniref:7-carboxy-7-deazaguanine synthase n=1 Tax=Glaciecola petra TaxID=3075602 RepID=A0ABU2ZMS8_9ALTE|nr:7-carboxy-7-deazaguanine synthase QueE [Aestuariibacter sp. P117]MDT0593926.1 7-carboxy-7-deazaguanine synthase QueE [Aestuariibacter sp. P117]